MRSRSTRLWSLVALGTATALVLAGCGSGDDDGDVLARDTSGLRATDVAAEAGIAQASETHGESCIADIDGDGLVDMLVSHHADPWVLYLGRPDNTFVPDEKFQLEHLDRHACAVADFNADGRLDIYIATGGCRGTCTNAKELWIQQADHSFVNQAEQWGIADPEGRGRVAIALDANGDDLPDLFTGQAVGVDYPSLSRLWINRGDHFEAQDDETVTNELGGLCAAAADVDGDGIDELAFCSREDGFFLLRSRDGHFVDDTERLGLDRAFQRTAEFADLDGDGRPDLITMSKSTVRVHINDGGRYGDAVFSRSVESGADIASGDCDGDGDLDIYVQERGDSDAPDQLLLNRGDGTGYTLGPELPEPADGGGESVVEFPDWNASGRAAFVVNNGYQESPGPRQLIVCEG